MSVQVENLEKNMAKLTIEVSAEELEKALQESWLIIICSLWEILLLNQNITKISYISCSEKMLN